MNFVLNTLLSKIIMQVKVREYIKGNLSRGELVKIFENNWKIEHNRFFHYSPGVYLSLSSISGLGAILGMGGYILAIVISAIVFLLLYVWEDSKKEKAFKEFMKTPYIVKIVDIPKKERAEFF